MEAIMNLELTIHYPMEKTVNLNLCGMKDRCEEPYCYMLDDAQMEKLKEGLETLRVEDWNQSYMDRENPDRFDWDLKIVTKTGKTTMKYGRNKTPDNWLDFLNLINTVAGETLIETD